MVRLEIVLWERIDARLRQEHKLSVANFEALYFLSQESEKSLRVGDLARLLQVNVGGTSKLIDRVEWEGLIRRDPGPTNRRASLIVLTATGESAVTAASTTYQAEMANVLDGVLTNSEQLQMHEHIVRLLNATVTINKEPEA